MYQFMPIIPGDDVLRNVFPTKQRAAQKAIDLARSNSKINRLILFGSAVTPFCGMTSDLDLAVDAPELSEDSFLKLARMFYREIDSEVDVVHYNTIQNSLLKNEIDEKGVDIYVKCK